MAVMKTLECKELFGNLETRENRRALRAQFDATDANQAARFSVTTGR